MLAPGNFSTLHIYAIFKIELKISDIYRYISISYNGKKD